MNTEIDAIDAVARAVDRVTHNGRFAELELQNGIRIGVKPVPPHLLTAVANAFEYPDPPVFMNEDKGREEPNPNDPNYRKEIEKIDEKRDLASNDLVLAVGTYFISAPDGYFGPNDNGWIKDIEFAAELTGAKLEIPPEGVKRYLFWLRMYALESTIDLTLAQALPLWIGGIRENEVDEVVESFRSPEKRGTDSGDPAETGRQNGDPDNRASRRARSRI